jgi:hypothetical protein
MRSVRLRVFAGTIFAGVQALTACSAPSTERGVIVGPSKQDFEFVSNAMNLRCGSLECHGTVYRNMRLYGYGALRLDAYDLPSSDTKSVETEESYRSIVGLEPELMYLVSTEKTGTERLSLVRKGRGMDNHKGRAPMVQNVDLDRCIASWLVGAVDVEACKQTTKQ